MTSHDAVQIPDTNEPSSLWSVLGGGLQLPSRLAPLESAIERLFHPIVILFALVTALLVPGITKGEFFYRNDENSHAMNGVFFRDVFVDLPLRHPLQYVMEYYAKYPTVKFPYWPPLFHLTEGLFFLVLGISPWVSRLAILCYALLAVYFWYRIAERLGPRYRAFLSTVILISLPFVLFQARVTMLEIPALATSLGAVYFWLKFLDAGRRSDLWALAGFVVAAFLISQKALFLAFFFGFDFIIERRFQLLRRVDVWLALIVSLVIVLPWYALAFHTVLNMQSHVIGHGNTLGFITRPRTYTFYLVWLYRQLGTVLACLAGVGVLVALWKRTFPYRTLLVWVVAGYVCFSLLNDKDSRYTLQWISPLIYLSLVGLEAILVRRKWVLLASSALALYLLVNAFFIERPIVSGAKDVAEFVVSQPQSDIIYFQGSLDRDFTFFVRKFDPAKSHMVLKGKQAVLMATGSDDPNHVLQDEDVIPNMFRAFGIRYVMIQDLDGDASPADRSVFQAVRKLLSSDQFELVRTFPIQSNQPDIQVRQISVFRYRGELHRTLQAVTLPMDSIGQGIPVDLSRLVGRPWPN